MAVSLRRLSEADLLNVMQWRMMPEVTKYMNTDPVLTIEGQREWFKRIENDKDKAYWIISVNGEDAGVINLTELTDDSGVSGWAYYIGEKRLRGMKTALSLEMSMYDYALLTLSRKSIVSDVFSKNTGVIALHKLCGCEIIKETKNAVTKNGEQYDVTYMEMTAERWQSTREGKSYEHIAFPND
ncbi:MAG: UDP-4-amino-4,6-dideoxy-N-acetyl-beta-L-altrosamine N-acetyltransferase [Lachnospiraceae bacterium]|nr:UDP-4-amino-4,6-dideoxy-N-acetyl-beta-L-altrosamine N-acetyltransferase [Lachnospiraceae bacterium]